MIIRQQLAKLIKLAKLSLNYDAILKKVQLGINPPLR